MILLLPQQGFPRNVEGMKEQDDFVVEIAKGAGL